MRRPSRSPAQTCLKAFFTDENLSPGLIDEVYAVASAGIYTTLEFSSMLQGANEKITDDCQHDDNNHRSNIRCRLSYSFLISFTGRWHGGACDNTKGHSG